MKALKIYETIKRALPNTIQIVHARNYDEIVYELKLKDVYFIHDDWFMSFLWKSIVLRLFCDVWFSYKAVKLAEKIVINNNINPQAVVIHQIGPNSPVSPRTLSQKYINFFGPINGNIYYPKIFFKHESLLTKFRRLSHKWLQFINLLLPRGIKAADLILAAGGKRTVDSLKLAGCENDIIHETLDYGLDEKLLSSNRIVHNEVNYRFVQYGRVVFHKCSLLVIESLVKTKLPIQFDIIGTGPELDRCKQLVEELNLGGRVNFIPWYLSHDELINALDNYRALVLPSIEDANGIVVQEAMSRGLPAIALDWGGPQLLIDHEDNGFLISPHSKDYITDKLAEYMDRLAGDPTLAEEYSKNAKKKSEDWDWNLIVNDWFQQYKKYLDKKWGAADN